MASVNQSVNQRLADASIDHGIDLLHYANGVVLRMIALLNRVDADLAAALSAALERLPAESFTVERLEGLLGSVRSLNQMAYAATGSELLHELRRLVEYEAGHQYDLFGAVVPPQVQASVGIAAVNVEQVYAAAMARPFQGRLLREWAAGIEAGRMQRIRDAVRMGYVEQQPIADIVRRVRGTRARGYSDGIIEIDRRHAEAVVRTAIGHTAGVTRDRFYEGNGGLVKAIQWVATLDARTSETCRPRDAKQYTPDTHKPIGHSLPWLGGPGRAHWSCRSSAVPVLKSWRELGGGDIQEFAPSTRASMDGQVAAKTTYADWLQRQSAARQDEILGPKRGALLRKGGLELPDLYDHRGRYLTLDELRARDAAAFERAGLQ